MITVVVCVCYSGVPWISRKQEAAQYVQKDLMVLKKV